jgi:CRISPR-associated protein Cas6
MKEVFDFSFRIYGNTIPLDHGYALYSSLSKAQALLHDADWLAIHPISGIRTSPGILTLTPNSRLSFRIPLEHLEVLLAFAGKRLELTTARGKSFLQIGVPEIYSLKPNSELYSHFVTIKVSEAEKNKQAPNREMFLTAVRSQLRSLEIEANASIDGTQTAKGLELSRRVIHIKKQTIVGYAVNVSNLSDEHSLKLQASGLGGRRRFGAGIFNRMGHGSESKEQG